MKTPSPTPCAARSTTKHENARCHSGLDPESSHKGLDTGSRIGVRGRLCGYDDVFSYKARGQGSGVRGQ
ncbi:MAG: hypothetical protein COX16_03320 [Deltaproteobacteria bacterium CG23_combo_of_CG06-09_8_20_14_all_51_20]|nr:MAG: hypothetical protein COX16_03320 [Deltaproteobacteria bacterium CG23_combo_of_CG06-09_8_20_14_all_51_20]